LSSKSTMPLQSRLQPCSGRAAMTCAARRSLACGPGQGGRWWHIVVPPRWYGWIAVRCRRGEGRPGEDSIGQLPAARSPQVQRLGRTRYHTLPDLDLSHRAHPPMWVRTSPGSSVSLVIRPMRHRFKPNRTENKRNGLHRRPAQAQGAACCPGNLRIRLDVATRCRVWAGGSHPTSTARTAARWTTLACE